MFTAKDSQTSRQLSAPKLSILDRMTHMQHEQNYDLPYFNPASLMAGVAFLGQANSSFRGGEFFKLGHPLRNFPYPSENVGPRSSHNALPHGLGPIDPPRMPQEKRFLIFDRSGNHTTYFFSPSFCSWQNPVAAPKDENLAARADQLPNPLIEEKCDGNVSKDGEDEMLDDNEEIDALLYSDSDEEEEEEEVTSTRLIPFITEGGSDKKKVFEEVMEEVASCDSSPKRRRLIHGGHKKSSPPPSSSLVNFENCVNEATSSCNGEDDIDSSKRNTKVKIRQMMKILGSLVPGLECNKDPTTIIEKAIVYLKSMKIEAKALGLACTVSELPACP